MRRAEVLANALGMSVEDVKEYAYQPGQWSQDLYAIGDEYFCVTKSPKSGWTLRVTSRFGDASMENWEPVKPFRAVSGWTVWKATT